MVSLSTTNILNEHPQMVFGLLELNKIETGIRNQQNWNTNGMTNFIQLLRLVEHWS